MMIIIRLIQNNLKNNYENFFPNRSKQIKKL